MSTIKLIALDMDGTLLNDDGIITKHTKGVIKQALNNNIQVVLSTGRPLSLCHSFHEELALTSYVVTSNGAEIWTKEMELLERHPINAGQIELLWEFGREHQLHTWMVAADSLYQNELRPENFESHEWLKFGFGQLSERNMDKVYGKLKEIAHLEVTNSSPTNIEINKKNVHKSAALQSICKQMGITMKEVMAVGDSLNDFKMIEQSGIGVAVANAQQILKDVADHVTDTNNNDGVAKAIERFAL